MSVSRAPVLSKFSVLAYMQRSKYAKRARNWDYGGLALIKSKEITF